MMTVAPLVIVDPKKLSRSNVMRRIVAIEEYLAGLRTQADYSEAVVSVSGWPEHLDHLIAFVEEEGWTEKLCRMREIGVVEYDRQMSEACDPRNPYARAYPDASWCFVKGLGWSAKMAQVLHAYDPVTGRITENHLDGSDQPGHPYYDQRCALIDDYREMRR